MQFVKEQFAEYTAFPLVTEFPFFWLFIHSFFFTITSATTTTTTNTTIIYSN